MKTGRRAVFAAVAILVALALASLLGEAVLRLLPPDERGRLRVRHPVYHHGLRPGARFDVTWGERPIAYRTNSLGFRDSSTRAVPLARRGPRVLFLGDSFTEGVGIDHADTFVARFGQLTGTEALNGGVVSYATLIEYLRLKDLIERGFSCDRVILMFDLSDALDELLYHSIVRTDAAGEPLDFTSLKNNRVGAWLYNNIHIVRFLYLRAMSLTGRDAARDRHGVDPPAAGSLPDRPPADARPVGDASRSTHFYAARAQWTEDEELRRRWADRGLALAAADIGRIQALCAAHGIAFDLVVYPWPLQLASDRVPSYAETVFEGLAAERGVRLVNLFPVFRAHPDWSQLFITGDVHWSEAGHALVADAVAEAYLVDALDGSPPVAADGSGNASH